MNLQNAQKLIDRLRGCVHRPDTARPHDKESFNMALRHFDCKSPGCVAGHCADLMGRRPGARATQYTIEAYLDIPRQTARSMYYGTCFAAVSPDITPQDVIEYLETLMREETA